VSMAILKIQYSDLS